MPITAHPAIDIEAALGQRDALIAELQEAVIELSHAIASPQAAAADQDQILRMLSALDQRMATIESRVAEQEQTLRHTLTMLIEWIEDGDPQARAA